MIRRLRKRFIRIAMVSVTVVIVLLTIIVNVANFISTNSDLNDMLKLIYENQGAIPMHNPPPGGMPNNGNDEAVLPDVMNGKQGGPFNQETPFSTRYFYFRFRADGSLAEFDLEHIAAVTEGEIDKYVTVALNSDKEFGYYSGYKYYVVEHGGDRYMAIFLDCYQELRAVKVVAIWSVVAGIICIAVVYILVVIFSNRAIKPVIQSTQRQKQFITDASHELKTPITVIATDLKVLELELGGQKWIDKAREQTEKLSELVNSLVTLSRLDEEESPLLFAEFAISDAVSEVAGSFYDFSVSKGHEMEISVEPGIRYCGDEYAIRQLVSILLDNAVKYAVEHTPVFVSMKKERKYIVIHVINECEKIDTDDLDRLFDRFYRSDKSRNSSTGGFGIGLSIARSIAEGHKGVIKAVCTADHKIDFTVCLK
ncbi:MAG: HAMP domain-containing histidine kinase [Clostridium sp.]|nr:HAMP domain-containing histidine kinase [Clostridium sp.]MCM1399981.1 HAMP domain-containing histidine kinase [Clostridium sp.]MCM1460277.1 HAMP domain-containing histidine kinase [Bacteroides sp.]